MCKLIYYMRINHILHRCNVHSVHTQYYNIILLLTYRKFSPLRYISIVFVYIIYKSVHVLCTIWYKI